MKMEYDKMDREERELFNPLIEAAKKGLQVLKEKYSFEEAWEKFGDFLYVSHVLLSSEHPYSEIYWAVEERNPDIFGSYAYDWHKKFWNSSVEKIFGLGFRDEVSDKREVDWDSIIEEDKRNTPGEDIAG
jgi:PAS domain-containing protein